MIDLTPLTDWYKDAYLSDDGLIDTTYGLYAFGELTCKDEQYAAQELVFDRVVKLDLSCSSSSDCIAPTIVTDCSFSCQSLIISTSAEQDWEAMIDEINADICVDYEAAGSKPVEVQPCLNPPSFDCIDGQCLPTSI